ncbi:hypothetical protein QJQ45_010723 [Haematococcus lacustris]|nr:hypothetical protein QJQ45_010723 [Haematococcus lacustris]
MKGSNGHPVHGRPDPEVTRALAHIYCVLLDEAISRAGDFLPPAAILQHISTRHSQAAFGEFKATLASLFSACAYEQAIMNAASRLIMRGRGHTNTRPSDVQDSNQHHPSPSATSPVTLISDVVRANMLAAKKAAAKSATSTTPMELAASSSGVLSLAVQAPAPTPRAGDFQGALDTNGRQQVQRRQIDVVQLRAALGLAPATPSQGPQTGPDAAAATLQPSPPARKHPPGSMMAAASGSGPSQPSEAVVGVAHWAGSGEEKRLQQAVDRGDISSQTVSSEPGPSTPSPAKRTKVEQAAEPTQPIEGKSKAQGKAA